MPWRLWLTSGDSWYGVELSNTSYVLNHLTYGLGNVMVPKWISKVMRFPDSHVRVYVCTHRSTCRPLHLILMPVLRMLTSFTQVPKLLRSLPPPYISTPGCTTAAQTPAVLVGRLTTLRYLLQHYWMYWMESSPEWPMDRTPNPIDIWIRVRDSL